MSSAAHHAQQHAGDSSDSGIFSSVLSQLGQNKHNIGNQPIDEQRIGQASLDVWAIADRSQMLFNLISSSSAEEAVVTNKLVRTP
jgi:hypothetical protein